MTLDFSIDFLGEAERPSPLRWSRRPGDYIGDFVDPDRRLRYEIETGVRPTGSGMDDAPALLELAGPRERIFFDPHQTHAAVVTCGGLCPGLNAVIRSITLTLRHHYGVRQVTGIRYGYRGFLPDPPAEPVELSLALVRDIHRSGGTVLGSSRGYGDRTAEIADAILERDYQLVFTIGGDGTQRGARALHEELRRRGGRVAVVGVPKTIDNDLCFVQRSFGFETAVARACEAVAAAHVEAVGAHRGIGLVKVMGRQSGFIAAQTALANVDVNAVLVPEVPFDLEGPGGLLAYLQRRLEERGHAVIVVAEGAGQEHLPAEGKRDASGNVVLDDIGLYLCRRIQEAFRAQARPVHLKYIDPSYIIRAAAPNANDTVYCTRLGAHAAHAAMAGKSGLIVSLMHNRFVHVPMRLAVSQRNVIDPDGCFWRDVVEATGQPVVFRRDGRDAG